MMLLLSAIKIARALLPLLFLLNVRVLYSQEASVTMQLVLRDQVPKSAKRVMPPGIKFCGGREIIESTVDVDEKSRGIKDILLIAELKNRDYARGPEFSSKTHSVLIEHCQFPNKVLLIQAGDTVAFENRDPVPVDICLHAFANESATLIVPPNGKTERNFISAEAAFVHIYSSERPWMTMRIYVLPHRFAAVSDSTGKVEIHNLPEQIIEFKLWHPLTKSANGIKNVIREGDQSLGVTFPFEMDLGKGVSDLGVVAVPLSEFRLPSR